mgnify:CR=1 FL=1
MATSCNAKHEGNFISDGKGGGKNTIYYCTKPLGHTGSHFDSINGAGWA